MFSVCCSEEFESKVRYGLSFLHTIVWHGSSVSPFHEVNIEVDRLYVFASAFIPCKYPGIITISATATAIARVFVIVWFIPLSY